MSGDTLENFPIGLSQHTGGKVVTAYGQTGVTRDLCEARDAGGGHTVYEAKDVTIHDFDSDRPSVSYSKNGSPTHTGSTAT